MAGNPGVGDRGYRTELLTDEQRELIRIQKEREKALGLRDADE